jgi:hypothetical protein
MQTKWTKLRGLGKITNRDISNKLNFKDGLDCLVMV